MSNVLTALSAATSDTLNVVSLTTGTISRTMGSASKMAEALANRAEVYRKESALQLTVSAEQRTERVIHKAAEEDGFFYAQLEQRLNNNPEAKTAYEKSLDSLRAALAAKRKATK